MTKPLLFSTLIYQVDFLKSLLYTKKGGLFTDQILVNELMKYV